MDQGQWIDVAGQGEPLEHASGLRGLRGPDRAGGEGPVDRVAAQAPEPIGRVPVVGLAAVEDGVDEAAVGIGAVLHQVVCRVVVVVVQQCGGREQIAGRLRRVETSGDLQQPETDGGLGQHSGPGARAEFRKLSGAEEFPETGGGVVDSNREGHRGCG